MKKKALLLILLVSTLASGNTQSKAIITNSGNLQLGDNITCFSLAKILSLKHGLPFYYQDFTHAALFVFDGRERRMTHDFDKWPRVRVMTEADIKHNKHRKVVLYTDIRSQILHVSEAHVSELKKDLALKEIPSAQLHRDSITVGVHIRKGNGGGQYYDGEQSSAQEFDFDRSQVRYRADYENYAFDWHSYERRNGRLIKDHEKRTTVDRIGDWQTKFPPNQFYIDQIIKLSNDVADARMVVYLCTDDKDPDQLVQTFISRVNKSNVTFIYENDRQLPFKDRMNRDLYKLSQCDVLIRGQSYFSRTAELMGSHALVMYPLNFHWEGNKLIMHEIVVKGSVRKLMQPLVH